MQALLMLFSWSGGAIRILECWEDDVCASTDFRRAVKATPGEAVVFSWIAWPDKATQDAAKEKMMSDIPDPHIDPAQNPIPFDGKRMIFGGFMPVIELEK
ncbi:MAG: hypothetical protein ACI89D_001489 [Bermanella sp.]|jgi:uncharacterized protein YbaA (DUF1428 family)